MGNHAPTREIDLTVNPDAASNKVIVDIFKSVGDHFRNDISAIWQRSQVFLLSNLGLLAFFYSTAFNRKDVASVAVISVVGITTSAFWIAIVRVTIQWIDVWRRALVDVESKMVRFGPYQRGESIGGKQHHEENRPETFAEPIAYIFLFVWLLILIAGFFGIFK